MTVSIKPTIFGAKNKNYRSKFAVHSLRKPLHYGMLQYGSLTVFVLEQESVEFLCMGQQCCLGYLSLCRNSLKVFQTRHNRAKFERL